MKNENETELEYFYIDPEYIGKGYGKKMWDNLVNFARQQALFILIGNKPQAKGFYEKMGAVVTDEVIPFAWDAIPKLRYTVHRFWKGKPDHTCERTEEEEE